MYKTSVSLPSYHGSQFLTDFRYTQKYTHK